MTLKQAIEQIGEIEKLYRDRAVDYLKRYNAELDDEFAETLWHKYSANDDMRILTNDILKILKEVK